jgi:hypothetical protein
MDNTNIKLKLSLLTPLTYYSLNIDTRRMSILKHYNETNVMHSSFNLLRIKGSVSWGWASNARNMWRPLILNKLNEQCITLVSLYWYTTIHGQQNIKFVNHKLHAPPEQPVPTEQGAVWVPKPFWSFSWREKYTAPAGNQTRQLSVIKETDLRNPPNSGCIKQSSPNTSGRVRFSDPRTRADFVIHSTGSSLSNKYLSKWSTISKLRNPNSHKSQHKISPCYVFLIHFILVHSHFVYYAISMSSSRVLSSVNLHGTFLIKVLLLVTFKDATCSRWN